MIEKKLIGNILAEDEEDLPSRFTTKRFVLLNHDEVEKLPRSTSAPPDHFLDSQAVFKPWLGHPPGFAPSKSQLNHTSPEFVPTGLFTEELFAPSGSNKELGLMQGRLVEAATDQTGSRLLQQHLELCSEEERQSAFEEIASSTLPLSTDVFGNYVIQKLLEYGTREQRRVLADQLVGSVVPLSLQIYGCRVMQKALEVTELEQKKLLVREIRGQVEQCVDDQNGNHVVQKCIEQLPFEHVTFIVAALRPRTVYWAMHPYGCRVIQRIIEFSPREKIIDMIESILTRVADISKEAYGNYVIQHILEKGNLEDKTRLLSCVRSKVKELSKHKFASNVVEKCLICAPVGELELFAGELFGPAAFELMTDKYANFVVQKALEVVPEPLQARLMVRVSELGASLRTYTYGRHVLTALEKLRKSQRHC